MSITIEEQQLQLLLSIVDHEYKHSKFLCDKYKNKEACDYANQVHTLYLNLKEQHVNNKDERR